MLWIDRRLLAGLEDPTGGTLEMNGKPLKGSSLDRSVVFQDYGLFPWMTAGENIMLALQQKYPKKPKFWAWILCQKIL